MEAASGVAAGLAEGAQVAVEGIAEEQAAEVSVGSTGAEAAAAHVEAAVAGMAGLVGLEELPAGGTVEGRGGGAWVLEPSEAEVAAAVAAMASLAMDGTAVPEERGRQAVGTAERAVRVAAVVAQMVMVVVKQEVATAAVAWEAAKAADVVEATED